MELMQAVERRVVGERLRELEARAAWMLTWIAGCALIDSALGLTGPWAMLGGVITCHACEWVYGRMAPNASFSREPEISGANRLKAIVRRRR